MWKNYNRKQENNKHKILNNYYILGGQGDRYAWEALKEDLKGISSCRRRKQKDFTFHFTLPNNFYFFPMGTFLKSFIELYFTKNELFKDYTLTNFNICIHLRNHHHNEDNELTHYPPKFSLCHCNSSSCLSPTSL